MSGIFGGLTKELSEKEELSVLNEKELINRLGKLMKDIEKNGDQILALVSLIINAITVANKFFKNTDEKENLKKLAVKILKEVDKKVDKSIIDIEKV